MGVPEVGGELDLPEKAVCPEIHRQLGMDHLERDQALLLQILRQVDRRHPTATELALDAVAVTQGGLKAGGGVHGLSDRVFRRVYDEPTTG